LRRRNGEKTFPAPPWEKNKKNEKRIKDRESQRKMKEKG